MNEIKLIIQGTQEVENEDKNTIELVTEGKYYKKNDAYYLIYDESELSGMEGSTTTLKILENKITMKRYGSNNSKLVFERGIKHRSKYETMYGLLDMEVFTQDMKIHSTDKDKLHIEVKYDLNITNMISSKNTLCIKILN